MRDTSTTPSDLNWQQVNLWGYRGNHIKRGATALVAPLIPFLDHVPSHIGSQIQRWALGTGKGIPCLSTLVYLGHDSGLVVLHVKTLTLTLSAMVHYNAHHRRVASCPLVTGGKILAWCSLLRGSTLSSGATFCSETGFGSVPLV